MLYSQLVSVMLMLMVVQIDRQIDRCYTVQYSIVLWLHRQMLVQQYDRCQYDICCVSCDSVMLCLWLSCNFETSSVYDSQIKLYIIFWIYFWMFENFESFELIELFEQFELFEFIEYFELFEYLKYCEYFLFCEYCEFTEQFENLEFV